MKDNKMKMNYIRNYFKSSYNIDIFTLVTWQCTWRTIYSHILNLLTLDFLKKCLSPTKKSKSENRIPFFKQFLIALILIFQYFANAAVNLDKIKLPPGFKISVYAKDVNGARSMTWGAKGTLFVGTRNEGKVYAVEPNGKIHLLAEGLNMPNGIAFSDGTLYVAEVHRLIKFPEIESKLLSPPQPQIITTFPNDAHHGWKYLAKGTDSKLYISQGVPCNICEVKDPYGTIFNIDKDGSNLKILARGIRNSVGFDWNPLTHELWFTENGRDNLGDDVPPDELNRITKADLHFGYPYCHGGDILDPQFGKNKNCADYEKPEQKFGAHVASLGMRFYTGKTFNKKYLNQIFVAEHGSWNRSSPVGYRISLVTLGDNGHAKSYETFAEGWLQENGPWGRPVDIINAPDGSLLISDDYANVIYKIQYQSKK